MIDPQNLRQYGIGGSEVGAIFGVDEMRDEFSLWAEKKGGLPRPEPGIRMIVGKALEEGVLKLYTYKTGRPVEYYDRTMRHPDRPWMVYTPDALCTTERRGVDAKVVFWDQRRKWGHEADEIPERIQLQCWWYMAGMDYDVWDVAALMGEGEPRVYTIERDREAERVMLARVEQWHRRYIIGDERPAIDASDEAARWLQQAFPAHKRPDIQPATADEIDLLEAYAYVRRIEKSLAPQRALLESRLKEAIGGREGIAWDGGKFTWRRTKDSTYTDWESLGTALLFNFMKDEKERAQVLAEYARVKEGFRRIRFDAVEGDDPAALVLHPGMIAGSAA